MGQTFIPAVFYRGGTSKGVFFHARDLPADREACDPILLAALGSPTPTAASSTAWAAVSPPCRRQ